MVDGSDVSEEHTASIFRETEFGLGGTEVVGRKGMCVNVQSLEEIWPVKL